MKILFITGLYPHEQLEHLRVLAKGHIQNAPNTFQWAVVDGLVKNNIDFHIISFPFLPSFPVGFSCLYTPSSNIIQNGVVLGEMVSYFTLVACKSISIHWRLKKIVRDWISKQYPKDEKLVILTYTPNSPFISAVKGFKKKHPNVLLATIVTDLVDDMMNYKSNRSLLKRIQCSIEKWNTKRMYKHIDKFVLLTEAMVEKISAARDKYLVVEGIAVPPPFPNKRESGNFRSIFYSGTLEEFSGVSQLLDAFTQINHQNIQLIICGSGQLASKVQECALKDPRIIYKGLISREEVLELQKNSTILINPRRPDSDITRFSFPSKTMEYLSSGTPMIGYKLAGIPSEYYDYYYTVDSLSLDSLVHTIESVLSLPIEELNKKAVSAYDFIQRQKTSKIQIQRILNFLTK